MYRDADEEEDVSLSDSDGYSSEVSEEIKEIKLGEESKKRRHVDA